MAKSGMKATTLKGGLTNRSADPPTKKVSGPSVNKNPNRTAVSPQPKTLGPRYA